MTPERKKEIADYNRRWKAENRDKVTVHQRRTTLKCMYGMTLEQYEEMNRAQGGRCQTCGRVPEGDKARGRLHVDHCHGTGKIRGLLCYRCNLAIGHMLDDPELALKIASYLKEHALGHRQ